MSSFYKVVAFNIIATGTLGGMASTTSLYRNLGSEYITEPYTVNTVKSTNKLGM